MYDDDRATNLATCIPCIVNIYSSSLALPDLREGLGEIPLALVSEMRAVLGSMAEGVGEVTLESLAAMDGALVREVRNVAIQRLSDASAGKDAEIERLRAADPSRPARSLDSAAAASLEAANATLLESAGAKDLEIAGYQEACAGKDRALGTCVRERAKRARRRCCGRPGGWRRRKRSERKEGGGSGLLRSGVVGVPQRLARSPFARASLPPLP
jgi:hypothetical protein